MSTISFADLMRMQAEQTEPLIPEVMREGSGTVLVPVHASAEEEQQHALSIQQTDSVPVSTLNPAQQRALDSFMSRANLIVDEAQSVVVASPADLERAASMRQDILQAVDLLEALKRPEINAAHAAHKAALAELNRLTAPWSRADSILKSKQDEYQRAVWAEKEKERRLIQETLEKAQRESLAAQMEEAQRANDAEKVNEILARPVVPVSIPFIAQPVKAAGTTGRMKTTVKVVDITKLSHSFLLAAIAAEVADKGECTWLTKQVNAAVKKEGKHAGKVIGEGAVEIGQEPSTGRRRRAEK